MIAAAAAAAGGGLWSGGAASSTGSQQSSRGSSPLPPAARGAAARGLGSAGAPAAAGGAWAHGVGAAPIPGVSDELAAIGVAANPELGPRILQAMAQARHQCPLQRSYVKNLEVKDVTAGADVYVRLRTVMGEGQADLAEFRRLGGLLFLELVAEDAAFDPHGGVYDAHSLLGALRELLELCTVPSSGAPPITASPSGGASSAVTAMVPHDSGAAAAAIGAAMANALGAALSGLPPPSKQAAERMSVTRILGLVEAFNQRPNAESVVTLSDVANRTVFAHLYESAVANGVWPQGEQTAPSAMAPFANSLGVFNTTDIPALMLNPKSGNVEDASRDPTAAPPKSTEEYLAKVRILFVSLAVMLYGVKCDKPPHHIPGCESEDFCSFLACNEWLGFLDGLGKASLKVVRSVVELTLRDVAAAANTRSGARVSFTRALRANFGELKKRAEVHLITLLETGGAGGSSSAELSTPAAAKAAGAQSEDRIAEAITAAITTGLAGLIPKLGGGLSLSADDKRRAADERSRKRREYEAEYEVDGASVKRKAQKGGYDDAPRCTRRGCQKASWCAYSHAHMACYLGQH